MRNKLELRFRYVVGSAGVVVALCVAFTPAFAQGSYRPGPGKTPVPVVGGFDKVHPLPPGGPAPRMADGHVDLTGRWYPNAAGRMLQFAYPSRPRCVKAIRSRGNAGGDAFLQAWHGNEIQEAGPLWRLRSGRYSKHDVRARPLNTAPMELIQSSGKVGNAV